MYIAGLLWKRTFPHRAEDIDLDTGRKSWLTVEDMREVSTHVFIADSQFRRQRAAQPWPKRLYRVLFC